MNFPLVAYLVKNGFPGSSADKESACSAGDPGSIPGSGRSPGEELGYPLSYSWTLGFPRGSDSEESTYNAGDLGSIPGLGGSPEEGMATHSAEEPAAHRTSESDTTE